MTEQRPPDNAGDPRDITTSLGATAMGVAAYRAAETIQPNPLIHDEVASVLVSAAATPGWQRLARLGRPVPDDLAGAIPVAAPISAELQPTPRETTTWRKRTTRDNY
jgi:O-methyltransferase involved in polyketide biosynthesis